MARKDQYNGSGLGPLMVVGAIVTIAIVALRVLSRLRFLKTKLRSDDWAIIGAQVRTLRSLKKIKAESSCSLWPSARRFAFS